MSKVIKSKTGFSIQKDELELKKEELKAKDKTKITLENIYDLQLLILEKINTK